MMAAEPSQRQGARTSLDRAALATIVAVGVIAIGIGAIAIGRPQLAAGALALGTTAFALLRPTAAITCILLLFPFQPLGVRVLERDFGMAGSALVIASAWKELALGAVLIVVVAPRLWRLARWADTPRRLPVLDLLAGVLLALVAIGLVTSHTLGALNQARLLLFPIGLYLVLRVGVLSADRVMKTVLASGVIVAVFGIVQSAFLGLEWVQHYFGTPHVPVPATFTATFLEGPRASGTLGSPNEFAFMCGICAIIAIALMASASRRVALAYGSTLFVLLPALALSFSRSALIGCFVGIVIAVALVFRATLKWTRVIRLLSVTLLPAVVVTTLLFVSRGGAAIVSGTIDTVTTLAPGDTSGSSGDPGATTAPPPGTDSSTVGHMASLTEGLRVLTGNPFGIGLGNVGSHGLPGEVITGRFIVESWYLSMGLALGIAGLLWSIAVVLSMALSGTRAATNGQQGVGLALAGAAAMAGVVGLVLPTMLEPQLAMLLWALAAGVTFGAGRHPT